MAAMMRLSAHRLIVEIVHAAVEVGRFAHQRRHVFRGGHIEEGTAVDVRRLDNSPVPCRYLIVADAVVVQVGVFVVERILWALLLLVRLLLLRLMVDCVLMLVLGHWYRSTGGVWKEKGIRLASPSKGEENGEDKFGILSIPGHWK